MGADVVDVAEVWRTDGLRRSKVAFFAADASYKETSLAEL